MNEKSIFVVGVVFEVLNKMNKALDRNLQVKDYYEEGLNKSHIKTLLTLHMQKSGSMADIGRKVGLVKGAFSPLIDRLIQLEYVKKTPSLEDRRKSILSLTTRGEAYAHKIGCESASAFQENFKSLTITEQQEFMQHLKSLVELLDILNSK